MKEQLIVRQILEGLAANRIFAFRLNSAVFSGEHKGKKRFFKSHSLGSGAADILAMTINRRVLTAAAFGSPEIICDSWIPLWIEVKNETGKQSPEQNSFQEYVEGLGHRYVLARDWTDVEKVISA